MNKSRRRRLRDLASGPATLIGEGCKITGNLSGNGNFVISGEVDGDCDLAGTLTVTSKGHWRGTLNASAIVVAGTIDGDIVCSGQVEIGESARVTGTVTGAAIAVAAGAVVQGTMQTTEGSSPTEFVEKREQD